MADKLRAHVAGVRLGPSHVIKEIERIDALVLHGRNEMLGYGDNPWPYVGPVVMTGTLVYLGAVSEAMDVLCEMDDRYNSIRKRHKASLKEWKDARHDVSHHIDRIFRERTGRSPIGGPFDTIQIAMASMRPENEIRIQTGSLVSLSMNAVTTQLKEILDEVRAVAPVNRDGAT